MNTSHPGGASISACARTPSIDLPRLAELMVKALDLPAAGQFITAEAGRLEVNSGKALRLLFETPGFKEDLAPSSNSGFIRDIEIPPRGTVAKVGGRLLPGSEIKVTSAIEKLHVTISRHLDTALTPAILLALAVPSTQAELDRLAEKLNIKLSKAPEFANLQPIGFMPPGRKAADQKKDVARLLSAMEEVEGRDWLELLLSGISSKLKNEDQDNDEIELLLSAIRDQREQPGSQVQRFLTFLSDEALARVRLQVTFQLMQSVAARSNSTGLKAYVIRVLDCFRLFAGTAGKSLLLDVSLAYGQRNNSDLGEHLRKALFYGCLPVWAEGSIQIFEALANPEKGGDTKREVSYRFRVNGINPETGKSAFASRLERIEERLLDKSRRDANHTKAIAELVFLWLVIPDSLGNPSVEDIEELAQVLVKDLKADPEGAVCKLIADLRNRESVMEQLAKDLIEALKTKSTKLVDETNRIAGKYYVVIHKGIVDWAALRSRVSRNTDVLVKNESGHDHIAWFRHLTITENPSEVRGLASYWVETHLVERSISRTGSNRGIRMIRQLGQPVLPVHFVPYIAKAPDGCDAWEPVDALATAFDVGCGICFQYDERSLTLTKKDAKNDMKARAEQLRASACAAFALLAYLIVWEVTRRLRQGDYHEGLAVHLIRLQPKGRGTAPEEGASAVYAACQAIERALSRELLVKMQGFNTQGDASTAKFRKKNSLLAMRGGFPIMTAVAGSLEKVAVVSYVTRPCDTHPLHPDADGYLFLSRAFCADRQGDAMRLCVDQMHSRFARNPKEFREPQLILEEVARLRDQGYRHIILLSHHFGNRHIGRAAERHAPHSTYEFLESVAARFPDVLVYSLRRDVFPATRLHKRSGDESAFEATSFAEHQQMYEQFERNLLRGLQPVYTFATLAVVSDSGRPQSGFCTYFFDLDQRLSNLEWSEAIRQNILGTTEQGKAAKETLLGVLRGLHYLESERAPYKSQVLPVLDPFGWAVPASTAAAGELQIMGRRGKGNVLLSFQALLTHVTKILHKDRESG